MATTIITEQPIEHSYLAIAGQDDFDFDFQIFNGAADLLVTIDGLETSSYSITLVGAEGGFISLNSPCVGGETVVIRRELALERVTQFPITGPVGMATVNHEFNRVVGMVQQLDDELGELILSFGYDDEKAVDALATALVGGSGIAVAYNDGSGTITISNTVDVEMVRDTIGATLVAGVGMEIVVNDVANTVTLQSTGGGGGGLTTEDVRDTMGTALVAGAGITITVNDASDTITITNVSGAYTDEQARDAIGTALVVGAGLTKVVDDAADTITLGLDLVKVQSFFVPAAAMKPRASIGPAAGTTETSVNKNNFDSLDFDASALESAQFLFRMPKSVNEAGNFTASFGWIATAASGGVCWGIRCSVMRDNVSLDTGTGGGQSLTDSVQTVAVLHISVPTAPFTIPGLVAEDIVFFEVYRDATNAADTMAGDAKLLWVDLKIPINGFDDA